MKPGAPSKPLTAEQLAVMKTMYKVETEAEAIKKLGKRAWWSAKNKIRTGTLTGVGVGRPGEMRRTPSAEWLKFSEDPKFVEFFAQQIKTAGDKAKSQDLIDLKKVMNKHNLTVESPPQDIFEKFVFENNKAQSIITAKDSLITPRSYHKIVTDKFNLFKRLYGTMSPKEFTEALPAMKGYKNPSTYFTQLRIGSKYTDESLAKMDPGSVAHSIRSTAQRSGRFNSN